MKDSVNLNSNETFSIEVRRNNEVIEKIENIKKYLIKNTFKNEIEYSYALHQEN